MAIYDVNGNEISASTPTPSSDSIRSPILSINHKGYRVGGAAENSMAAFRASLAHGFRAIETDIRYSSDNIPVLAHNETFSQYTIADTTCEILVAAGIATLEDLISYCKKTGLIPYLELKVNNNSMTDYAVDVVSRYGMMNNVVWISAYYSAVKYVTTIDKFASVRKQTASLSDLQSLDTGANVVGSYYATGAAGSGVNISSTIPIAKAGYVVGGFTYSSQIANFVIDNARGATEFTTDRYKAEDYIVDTE